MTLRVPIAVRGPVRPLVPAVLGVLLAVSLPAAALEVDGFSYPEIGRAHV